MEGGNTNTVLLDNKKLYYVNKNLETSSKLDRIQERPKDVLNDITKKNTFNMKEEFSKLIKKFMKFSITFKIAFVIVNLIYEIPLIVLFFSFHKECLINISIFSFFMIINYIASFSCFFSEYTFEGLDFLNSMIIFISSFFLNIVYSTHDTTSIIIFSQMFHFYFYLLLNLISYSANNRKTKSLVLLVIIYVIFTTISFFLIYDVSIYCLLFCLSNIFFLMKNLVNYKLHGIYVTNFEIILTYFVGIVILNANSIIMNGGSKALIIKP